MQRLFWLAALVSVVYFAPCIGWADDQQLSQQIADGLTTRLKNYSVGVRAQDGTVWLNGSVSNQSQMAAAIETAQKTPGVERVVNNLSIGRPAAGAQSDNRSNLRQPVVQASMELPEHAQQQLSMAGPMGDGDDEPAQVRANRSSQAADQAARNPGYYADPPAVGGPATNAGYAPRNMAASQAPPAMMRPMGQQSPLPLAMNGGPYHQSAMQNGGPNGPGEMIGAPQPLPSAGPMGPGAPAPYHFDHPQMPGYAWPSYAAYPNYAAVTYPKQYSPTAWPYIGPFYPYPQVPLGWRKVTLEWENGWWFLDFKDSH
jgi:hypothetical protein